MKLFAATMTLSGELPNLEIEWHAKFFARSLKLKKIGVQWEAPPSELILNEKEPLFILSNKNSFIEDYTSPVSGSNPQKISEKVFLNSKAIKGVQGEWEAPISLRYGIYWISEKGERHFGEPQTCLLTIVPEEPTIEIFEKKPKKIEKTYFEDNNESIVLGQFTIQNALKHNIIKKIPIQINLETLEAPEQIPSNFIQFLESPNYQLTNNGQSLIIDCLEVGQKIEVGFMGQMERIAPPNLHPKVFSIILTELIGGKQTTMDFSQEVWVTPNKSEAQLVVEINNIKKLVDNWKGRIKLPKAFKWKYNKRTINPLFSFALFNLCTNRRDNILLKKIDIIANYKPEGKIKIKKNDSVVKNALDYILFINEESLKAFDFTPLNLPADGGLRAKPVALDLRFDHSQIADIYAEEINVELKFLMDFDLPHIPEQQRTLLFTFRIEKMLGDYWLAFDFGTSACTAYFSDDPNHSNLIRLNDPENLPDRQYFETPGGAAISSFYQFIPENKDQLKTSPENAVLHLSTVERTKRDPENNIPYLKSLLGFGQIESLDIEVEHLFKAVLTNLLQTSTLTEKLQEQSSNFNKIILSHPNNFSSHYKKLFRNVFYQVFKNNIVNKETHIKFLSESDAVAFYYAKHWAKFRSASEHILLNNKSDKVLVYDLGAGTLDLTYVEIFWKALKNQTIPENVEIKTLGHYYLPKAGNYLDFSLAQGIAELIGKNENGGYLIQHLAPEEFIQKKIGNINDSIDWKYFIQKKLKPNFLPGSQTPIHFQDVKTMLEEVLKESFRDMNVSEADIPQRVQQTLNRVTYQNLSQTSSVKGFIDQVTSEAIEILTRLSMEPGQILEVNQVIMSGRSVSFPLIHNRIQELFPNKAYFVDEKNETKKSAVVRGLISYINLKSQEKVIVHPKLLTVRLGCLLDNGGRWTYQALVEPWEEKGLKRSMKHIEKNFKISDFGVMHWVSTFEIDLEQKLEAARNQDFVWDLVTSLQGRFTQKDYIEDDFVYPLKGKLSVTSNFDVKIYLETEDLSELQPFTQSTNFTRSNSYFQEQNSWPFFSKIKPEKGGVPIPITDPDELEIDSSLFKTRTTGIQGKSDKKIPVLTQTKNKSLNNSGKIKKENRRIAPIIPGKSTNEDYG